MMTVADGYVEATPGVVIGVNAVLEARFSASVDGALLDATNLPAKYQFRLCGSTRDAKPRGLRMLTS